jgi:hypothetical protein
LLILAAPALYAAYSVEQQGTYVGTVTGKNYVTGQAVDYKGPATLVIGTSTWSLDMPQILFPGTSSQMLLNSTSGAILHDSVAGFHLHASLHFKTGKSGTSVKGPVLLQTEGNGSLLGNIEAKLSLKKQAAP